MYIVAIILFLLAVLATVIAVALRNSDDSDAPAMRTFFGLAGGILLVLGVLATVLSMVTTVGTKEVGIVTSFSRPVGALDNGIHFKAPWQDVTEMDAAIQTDNHLQADNGVCVPTRIAHQIIACVDVTIRWRIREAAADGLFRDYRDFANVRSSLVSRELATDVNSRFATYDPLAVDATGNTTAPSLSSLASGVVEDMRTQINDQIEMLSVFIPVLHFDGPTQGRLNALQAQIAQTRIAQQAIQTAEKQAAANHALAASVTTDPNVIVSKCFDIVAEMVSKGLVPPPAFSCWPGGSSGVVIPAAPK